MFKLVEGKIFYEIDISNIASCECDSDQMKSKIKNTIYLNDYYNEAVCHEVSNHIVLAHELSCPVCTKILSYNNYTPMFKYTCTCLTEIEKVISFLFVWEH